MDVTLRSRGAKVKITRRLRKEICRPLQRNLNLSLRGFSFKLASLKIITLMLKLNPKPEPQEPDRCATDLCFGAHWGRGYQGLQCNAGGV